MTQTFNKGKVILDTIAQFQTLSTTGTLVIDGVTITYDPNHYDYWVKERDYYTQSETSTLLNDKANKVSSAVSGNFAGLDSSGNLTDSGYKPSDFQELLTAGDGIDITNNEISIKNDSFELIEKIIVGYSMTTRKPDDWDTNWVDYFINTGTVKEPVYTAVTGESAPTWETGIYYAYNNSGDVVVSCEKETDGTNYNFSKAIILATPPADWDYSGAVVNGNYASTSPSNPRIMLGTAKANTIIKIYIEIQNNIMRLYGVIQPTHHYATQPGFFNLFRGYSAINKIQLATYTFSNNVPAGTKIEIYAVRS